MITLPAAQQDELWDKYWHEMANEWFKLEVLQDYTGEDDGSSLRAWLKGDKNRSIELLRTDDDPEFTRECCAKRDQGVKLTRIHMIEEPPSPYMLWELEYYKYISIPLRSEQVSIIHKADVAALDLPDGDLMIFDGRRAIENSYDKTGRMVQANFYDERDDLSQFIKLKKALESRSRPL